MSILSTKKINKLKTNKIVRENINLNKSDILVTKMDISFNCIDESNWVSQLPEINLTNQLNYQNLSKKEMMEKITANFKGMIAITNPKNSWAAKWLNKSN